MGVLRRGELKMEIFKSRYVQVLGRIVRYLIMIFLGAILVFPFFYMVTRSFMYSAQVLARPVEMIPNPFTFEAYREIFLRNNYFGYLLRTLEIEIFNLIAIPFFILAGNIMNKGGIAIKLINFAKIFTGRIPGSLAHTNVVANMLFGAISGSGTACR